MNIVERKGEIPDPDFDDLAPKQEPDYPNASTGSSTASSSSWKATAESCPTGSP